MKRLFNAKSIMRFIFATFLISIAYIIVKIVLAPTVAPASEVALRVKSDYVLMLVQSIFGVIAMLLPGFLMRKVRLQIPSMMMVLYAAFLYGAIYLGEVRDFYYRVPYWDVILHGFSGAALGALGFSVISLLNKSEAITFKLSPVFVALFAFCFAVALGVVWEVYEFAVDSLLHTNMQKYALESGAQLAGQAALRDTMKDLIVDTSGALAMSVLGYISLKHDKMWLERVRIKRK